MTVLKENQEIKLVFLSGNEALARGAWEAGLKVACAYPGTPSTEIIESLSNYSGIDSQWSVNEKVAYEVALGASFAGVRSLYASKHVGVNVAMDPLMTSSYTGVNAGFVVVIADDPGLHSSQNEQDTRWIGIYAKLPILEPSNPNECYSFVFKAFEISEMFDTPVIIRMTTRVSHSKENIKVGDPQIIPPKSFVIDPAKYVMTPRNAFFRHQIIETRLNKLKQYSEETDLNKVESGSTTTGFITSGVTYHYIRENYPDASYLKLGMVWPLPIEKIKKFVNDVKDVMVIEELDPFLEKMISAEHIKIRSKHQSFLVGELKPELIPQIYNNEEKCDIPRDVRPPSLCKGCPHRLVYHAIKELDLLVSGDIGCYTLGALPPFSAIHSVVCMGAGITIHEGMRRALIDTKKKVVGIIGDSTFIHSGITGLINAAYNKCNGLIIILDNSITAMTGGQDNPGSGKTIQGENTKKICIEDICKVCGADNVDVVIPKKIEELKELIKKRVEEDALSVIIARSPCLLIK